VMGASMRACDRVITISTDLVQHLRLAYGLEQIRLIPNLSPGNLRAIPIEEAKAARGWQDKLVVQYSGNFGVAHEYQTLLDVIRRLRHNKDILFDIAGAGSNYDRLMEAARGLDNVIFEGYAPLDRLEWHLGAADISVVVFNEAFRTVLMPSKYYGILASGRAVLLIAGGQNDIARDILAEGIGLHFGHGEGQAIAQALEALAADPARLRAMGRHSRALYDHRYRSELFLEAYRDALR
ncbi:MAG TPA: glycosyltransferase family 4 protein, partial [Clostridia bacterium]|nr:glycosyltransferase family 4 protein [Clostridia bacterium]